MSLIDESRISSKDISQRNNALFYYSRTFKSVSNRVCAVGFEPNPNNAPRLLEIEEAYGKCGWSVKFFTKTGVSDHEGKSEFYTDKAMGQFEWGGGIIKGKILKRRIFALVPGQ